MNRSLLPLAAAALLSGCGIVSLPPVAIPDQILSLPVSTSAQNSVVYDGEDAFDGATMPDVLSNVSLSGQALYSGAGNLRSVAIFLRSSLPSCDRVAGMSAQFCAPDGESAQRIGTLNLQNGKVTDLMLSGRALDEAARAGHGYFGVQVLSGSSVLGDSLKLSNLKVSAKF